MNEKEIEIQKQVKKYAYKFKVLVMGDESSKIGFIKRYCYSIFDPNERLKIGVENHVKTVEFNEKKIKLQIWDVGGEERFRFLLPTYCLGADGAFFLYDITRPSTLDNISEWITIVRQKGGPIPIMLVGSKIELSKSSRQVPRDYGIQIAKKNNMASFVEISAKENININEAFTVLTEQMIERELNVSYKVVILGDHGVGKNTLIQRFLTNLFKSDIKMTIGVDFEVKSIEIDGRKVKLQIWMFGGEERFRFLLPTYIKQADGALLIYDVTNYASLINIDNSLPIIRKRMKSEQNEFPIIIVGNKSEVQDAREVTSEQGIEFAKSRGIEGFIECSAKTGENVEEAFDALTRLMMQR